METRETYHELYVNGEYKISGSIVFCRQCAKEYDEDDTIEIHKVKVLWEEVE